MRLQPQRAGGDRRIDAGLLLPSGFVTRAMDLTMVAAARPHGELIAHFPPECAVPREPQIVGIRVAAGRLLFVEPAVLVTIDPVTGFLGTGKINSNSITDVRGTLAPLGDLAERQNVAIHTVTHPPKTTTSAMNAFIGSQAFVAASRMAYLTTEEMDEGGAPTGRFLPRSAGMMFFKRGNAARLLPLSEWDPDDEAEICELLHAGRCNWLH